MPECVGTRPKLLIFFSRIEEPSTELDRLTWETAALDSKMLGRQWKMATLKAVQRASQDAACKALYASIADKKMIELTVKEDAARKSCEEAGFKP
jgi:hypothetical protein